MALGHRYTTDLLNRGADIGYTHELLGYNDSKTTNIYS